MEDFVKYIPFLIPLLAIELGLIIFVIVDIAKKKKTKNLSPLMWILIAVLLSSTFIGPILYIIFGRADPDSGSGSDDDI